MNTSEIFGVAELLKDHTATFVEGCQRSAVSRYYYSAFLEARDQLKAKRGISFKTKDLHESVKRAYYFSDDKTVKKVGWMLEQLRKLRSSADYEIASAHDPGSVGEAKAMSTEIRAQLASPEFKYSECDPPDAKGSGGVATANPHYADPLPGNVSHMITSRFSLKGTLVRTAPVDTPSSAALERTECATRLRDPSVAWD